MDIIRKYHKNEREAVVNLILEYSRWLNVNLCFQDFENEIREFPGKYSEPDGAVLIAIHDNSEVVGCVCLKQIDSEICEMKRLFTKEGFRNLGIGARLIEEIIREAKLIGYKKMRLDTLSSLTKAISLYKRFGFEEISAYYQNPLENVKYFEMIL